jgi:hypothetical protein
MFQTYGLYATNQEIHGINTRYNTNLHFSTANLTILQRRAFFLIKLFNCLPINIKNLSNERELFKPALKKCLLHVFYSTEEYFNNNNTQYFF